MGILKSDIVVNCLAGTCHKVLLNVQRTEILDVKEQNMFSFS
jgi:hypothetical protein